MISGNKILAVRLECPDWGADSPNNKHSMTFVAPVERRVFSFEEIWCMMVVNWRLRDIGEVYIRSEKVFQKVERSVGYKFRRSIYGACIDK